MGVNPDHKKIIIGLIIVLLLGTGVYVYNHSINPSQIQIEEENPPEPALIIHVVGEVAKPGVYCLKHGDRVLDAIEQAGGAAPLADLSVLNLAERIKDGQKITVPGKVKRSVSGKKLSGGKVRLNSATQKELESLPGVGPVTAKRIIKARPFSKLEDIMKVKTIGKKKFKRLKEKLAL